MSERVEHLPSETEYWTARVAQEQAEQRVQMLHAHIKRTQERFGLCVAALIGGFVFSLALEYARYLAGGVSISTWRCLMGAIPGLVGMAAVLAVSTAFVREVYEIPEWRAAFGHAWLLLFGHAPLSLFDLAIPPTAALAPYPSIIVQQGRVDEKHGNTPLARFGGPGHVIIFNDSAVFLERFGRYSRVAGPGAVFLRRFERVREAFDLRPQERSDAVTALTKDGIPVKTELQVRFQLACAPPGLAPRTPGIPYPVYKQALVRAGQCHLRAGNVDGDGESTVHWPERASGVGGTLRALIAECRLDELLEPHEPGRDPRGDIAKRLHDKLDQAARDHGAQILEVRMGTPEPTLDEVKRERVASWQSAWKSKVQTEKAGGIAEAIRERGLARAHAHAEIIRALAQEFQETVEWGTALPAEFIALQFIEALRRVWTTPGGMVIPSQAIHTLNYLQQMIRQDFVLSIPILKVSDGPDIAMGKHSDGVKYIAATGEFFIAGHTYRLYPLDRAPDSRLEFRSGAVYFALVIPEDDWLDSASEAGDYALVRWKPQVAQEGPGVLWTGEKWVGGRFERDVTTGDICFVPPRPHIIGEEQGYVVALLKPA